MSRKRWPDEAPVFDVEGTHYEGRPWMNASNIDDVLFVRGDLAFVDDDGSVTIDFACRTTFPDPIALTEAARELLAWSRQ